MYLSSKSDTASGVKCRALIVGEGLVHQDT